MRGADKAKLALMVALLSALPAKPLPQGTSARLATDKANRNPGQPR